MMKYFKSIFFSFLFIITLVGCEKDKKFAFDINNLIGVEWGYPNIEEGSETYIEPPPTVFYKNGRVTFGNSMEDFWQVRDSRSLLIQERKQIWQVIDLTENRLYVEKLRYPTGEFLVRCVYYPVQ